MASERPESMRHYRTRYNEKKIIYMLGTGLSHQVSWFSFYLKKERSPHEKINAKVFHGI